MDTQFGAVLLDIGQAAHTMTHLGHEGINFVLRQSARVRHNPCDYRELWVLADVFEASRQSENHLPGTAVQPSY